MIPREIFTNFVESQRIVSVNDFWFPLGFQELLQASLYSLRKCCFARKRLDPLGDQVLHDDCTPAKMITDVYRESITKP